MKDVSVSWAGHSTLVNWHSTGPYVELDAAVGLVSKPVSNSRH